MPSNVRRVEIPTLGPARFASPLKRSTLRGDGLGRFIAESRWVRHAIDLDESHPAPEELLFEKAGARERLFFDPAKTRAAVVTCGGLCPGLNNVIRSIFLELAMNYGVPEVLGIRYGYEGLNPKVGLPPLRLSMEYVDNIHEEGGSVLGSSRGEQDPAVIVDFLQQRKIDVLFCVGGDGTQRGAHRIHEEVHRRGLPIAVVGIPKTIDNDIAYCEQSFGLITAVEQADAVLRGAHAEARGARNGIGLVKVMGRDAGFIAALATLASQEVNFTLIPELPFALDGPGGFLAALERRILDRQHALIVVAEGAGQDLMGTKCQARDASGNLLHNDVGPFLKGRIAEHFAARGIPVSIKYIDPSYTIRSVSANCEDSILCDQFARRAVHAAMAGKTDVLVCTCHRTFIHVPIAMATASKRRVDVEGEMWSLVLSATGQPPRFG
ncbi:MAG: ATP-dependent 6-phosphofructokinase [Pirellulales bacterium]|nr:ATP-dependent 6-phosphofructokinase [Pirellulales bacterium]